MKKRQDLTKREWNIDEPSCSENFGRRLRLIKEITRNYLEIGGLEEENGIK
jgi:hypothetical protein